MRPEDRFVLAAAAVAFDEPGLRFDALVRDSLDWDAVVARAEREGTAGLLAAHVEALNGAAAVPAAARARLGHVRGATWARNAALADRWAEATGLMSRAGIPCLTHKGLALAHMVYPDPGLRPMADVDILVRPEDAAAALRVLRDGGYRAPGDADGAGRPFLAITRDGVTLDVHWHLADYSRFDGIVEVDHAAVWQRARRFTTPAGEGRTLGPEHALLHVALHLTLGSEFGRLVWFSDVDALVRAGGAALDWDFVLDEARRWRIRLLLAYVLDVARRSLGTPVPREVAERLRPSRSRAAALRACLATPWPPTLAGIGESRVYLGETLLMDRLRDVGRVLARSAFPPAAWLRSHYALGRRWQVPLFRVLHPVRFSYLALKQLR